jgi:hypothetical protein
LQEEPLPAYIDRNAFETPTVICDNLVLEKVVQQGNCKVCMTNSRDDFISGLAAGGKIESCATDNIFIKVFIIIYFF